MKNTFIISAIAATLAIPAMADITGSSSCTEGVLGTSANGSTANVDANWSQNRININWYNGNTKVSESYCMYDDTITLPTQPTKPGYTFAGWTLMNGCPSGTYSVNSQCVTLSQAVASCTTGTYFNGRECAECDSYENGTCYVTGCEKIFIATACENGPSEPLNISFTTGGKACCHWDSDGCYGANGGC